MMGFGYGLSMPRLKGEHADVYSNQRFKQRAQSHQMAQTQNFSSATTQTAHFQSRHIDKQFTHLHGF